MSRQKVVIVGAGAAGLTAAATAARAGASVLVLEERSQAGGQLLYRAQAVEAVHDKPAERPERLLERLVNEAVTAGADLRLDALAAATFTGNELLVVEHDRGSRISAGAIVVATGSTDLPFPFAGATYPGVFSARALQILMNQWQVLPGRRFAIVGTGPVADELAVDILLAGGEVAWSGVAPAPFIRADGREGVRGLTVGQDFVDVDVVAIAVGRQPDAALATMVGAPHAFSAPLGGFVPVVDSSLQSSVPGLIVAGDAAGVGSVAAAIAEGRLAGVAAAAALGLTNGADVDAARAAGGPELAWRMAERSALQPTFAQPYE